MHVSGGSALSTGRELFFLPLAIFFLPYFFFSALSLLPIFSALRCFFSAFRCFFSALRFCPAGRQIFSIGGRLVVGGWWLVGWLIIFGRRAVLLLPVATAPDEQPGLVTKRPGVEKPNHFISAPCFERLSIYMSPGLRRRSVRYSGIWLSPRSAVSSIHIMFKPNGSLIMKTPTCWNHIAGMRTRVVWDTPRRI